MTAWRSALALGLALLIGLPLLQPFLRVSDAEVWAWSAADLQRVGRLGLNTLLLTGGTVALVLPPGIALALLLFRGDLPGRSLVRWLLVFSVFIPLPVVVSSWQGMFGSDGLIPLPLGPSEQGRPWATGWLPALWIHAAAALPWFVLIVGLGTRWVEPELEEQALLVMPAWRVALRVTLPRCAGSVAAAVVFVVLFTAGEISVTDMMLVSTFAEEVHTQFTLGERDALGRTLVLSLPGLLALWGGLFALTWRLERGLPPLAVPLQSRRPFPARPRWLATSIVLAALAVLLLPMASLAWKVGLTGTPRAWSAWQAGQMLAAEARLFGWQVLWSVVVALLTGGFVAALALVACWLAAESRPLRVWLLALVTTAWLLPGPVVGIGLQELILAVVRLWPAAPWSQALYYAPSPLPLVWADTLRFLPAAVFFLWPVVRLVPRELREAVRLEGAGPGREFVHLAWPMARAPAGVVALGVAALSLGEVAAGTRVATPDWDPFGRLLFDRMHYGFEPNVAALSLLLLGLLSAIGTGLWLIRTAGWSLSASKAPRER